MHRLTVISIPERWQENPADVPVATAAGSDVTEVAVMGMIHSGHRTSEVWGIPQVEQLQLPVPPSLQRRKPHHMGHPDRHSHPHLQPAMTKITMPAGALLPTVDALTDLSGNRLPIGLSVKVGRLTSAVAEFHGAFMNIVGPIVAKHADGADSIGPGHKNLAAFSAEAEVHFAEQIEIEVEPVALAALEAIDGLQALPDSTRVLLELGFITDTPEGE